MQTMNLNEASKLNPGKNAIKASLLGSKTAATLVKTSQAALKQWPSLDREKKKAIYAKLAELKKAAKQNMKNEISGVKPEQKKAAAEKATQMYASFLAASKKQEETGNTVDISALEKKRDELKDWLISAQDEFVKAIEGKSDEEAEKIGEKMMADAMKKGEEYNKILQQIEDANKSNEAYSRLTEWFQILLEFDADKAVDALKDKVEDVVSGGGKESNKDKEDAIDDNELDTLLDELDALEEEDRDLEQELDQLNDEKNEAIKEYEAAAKKNKEAKDSGADQDTLYDLDDAEYEAEEKKQYAVNDYYRERKRIDKERDELNTKIKALKVKIQKLNASKNESRIVMTYESFLNSKYNS